MMIHILSDQTQSSLTAVQPGDSQPNAVDLRLGKLFAINQSLFTISEEEKVHRGSREIDPDSEGWYMLHPGSYEIVMENIISVGPEEAGWVITRSTFNRNGVFLTSGLYDSGYHGVMAGVMHVTCGPIKVKRGTRIGQFLLFKSQSLSSYSGSYGIKSDHDKKYA